MAVETLSGIPCHFESGNTIVFEEVFTDFPAASWAATLCLSLNGTNKASIAATESGDTFTFTISAAVGAGLTPGIYDFAIYVASGTERTTAKTGQIQVTPNLAASQTPTHAQAMVTALETVLSTFAASDKVSVSFNGQSFTRAGIADYQRQLVYWQSRVIQERQGAAKLRGVHTQQDYSPRFSNG